MTNLTIFNFQKIMDYSMFSLNVIVIKHPESNFYFDSTDSFFLKRQKPPKNAAFPTFTLLLDLLSYFLIYFNELFEKQLLLIFFK